MTIERSQNSQASEAAAAQRREAAEPREKVPPQPEQVDRFRAVMQQLREGKGEEAMPVGEEVLLAEEALSPGEDAGGAGEAAAPEQLLADAVGDRAARRADDLGLSASSLPPADAAAMMQAHMALRDTSVPAQAPPAGGNNQALFDLVERHVRQMAVGKASTAEQEQQVLLRMSDSTLPGTDLLLTRNGDGWILRADVRSRDSFDAIREAGPELARRFAERNLGTLSVESHYNG